MQHQARPRLERGFLLPNFQTAGASAPPLFYEVYMLLKIINHGVRLRRSVLWLFFSLLVLMSSAAAGIAEPPTDTVRVVSPYVIGAPFLPSWIPVWFFAFAGGVGALFFKIEEIDREFRFLLLAKPFLGVFGALALCLILSGSVEPPPPALSAYAFFAALLSAPILQALLAVASLKQNQVALFNKINPFKFKVIVPGKDDDEVKK